MRRFHYCFKVIRPFLKANHNDESMLFDYLRNEVSSIIFQGKIVESSFRKTGSSNDTRFIEVLQLFVSILFILISRKFSRLF